MKRIAFIIDSLTGGGAERSVVTLATEMARRGLETCIVTLGDESAYTLDPAIRHLPLIGNGERMPGNRTLARRLRARMAQLEQEAPFDLVAANLLHSSEVVKRAGIPGSYHCIHNPLGHQIQRTRHVLVLPWWRRHVRRLYNGEHLLPVSRGVGENLELDIGVRPASMKTISNGFDLEGSRKLALAPQPDADGLRPFVLHVGHFKRQKRIDRLLEAWARLDVEHRLVLLGTGSRRKTRQLREQAERLGIADSVVFPGFQENVYAWMARADLLVLASDFEGFGRVIVEALATGTPVVSTDCPSGPSDILTGPLARYLAPLDDPTALAERMGDALANPPAIDDTVVRPFAIERVADQYLALPSRAQMTADREEV
ncbi:glycosyltransferase [Thioalkalivibrio sp. ALMg11]|uniref:glycosyltransferase n=1 Tax=Thioalkalivibrio sp. ALMg11 TaxID=1158165 RepID=UPI000365630C|nr:glycosyltransferase [Thioalkalivibrio sp. ALMg11]